MLVGGAGWKLGGRAEHSRRCKKIRVGLGPRQQQSDDARIECLVLARRAGEVPGVYGEIGGQLHHVLPSGDIAEREVHGAIEHSRRSDMGVSLFDRGSQLCRPSRRVLAHQVAFEAVTDLGDRLAVDQWGHPSLLVEQVMHEHPHVPFAARGAVVPLMRANAGDEGGKTLPTATVQPYEIIVHVRLLPGGRSGRKLVNRVPAGPKGTRSTFTGKREGLGGVVIFAMVQLSVLDLATVASGSSPARALAESTEVAVTAERLGYHRFWVAEHHGMPAVASSAPAVLIAHVAAHTTSIRVGSGGVMLPNHAPLVIAEQFATLEALHPGRIDLGLGRAPGTDHLTARALRRDAALTSEHFPDDVVELYQYLAEAPAQVQHPAAVPGHGYLPEIWLLGSSLFSAQLAGHLGLPFAFAYHFSPGPLDAAVDAYRQTFRPSPVRATPRLMVAVSVVCAPSEEEARWQSGSSAMSILQLRSGRLGPLASPEEAASYDFTAAERDQVEGVMATHAIGTPDQVTNDLAALAERTDADELIISTRVHSLDVRLRSLELVLGAWDARRVRS